MKTLMTSVLFLLAMTAVTSQTIQAADASILGTWTLMNPIVTKTGPIALEFGISETQLNLKATCEFQEKSGEKVEPTKLSTSLTTAIELNSTEIKILEEQTANAEDGIKACRSFVTPTTWVYTLSEDGELLAVDAIVPYMQRLIFVRK